MSEELLRNEIERLRRENESLTAERRKHEEEHFQMFHRKLDAIALDAKTVATALASHSGQLKAVEEDVKTLAKVVLGNGTPERGLASRVTQMEESHKNGRKLKIGIALAAATGLLEAICHRLGI